MNKRIVVIGAGSSAGREILMSLSEKAFPINNIEALDFLDQKTKKISFGYEDVIDVHNLETFDFKDTDIAVIANIDRDIRKYTTKIQEARCTIIDCSGKMGIQEKSCLVVPDVNLEILEGNIGCKTIIIPKPIVSQIAIALKPLHDFAIIKRVVVSTYQSASELGKSGMDELYENTKKTYEHDMQKPKVFPKQIAFNIIPQVEDFTDNGYTIEEQKISDQLKEIIDKDITITATCVYVPVFICNSASINIEFKHPITIEQAKKELGKEEVITILDQKEKYHYATPAECAREDNVVISRIRKDETVENGLNLWVVSDNIHRISADTVKVVASLTVKN